MTAPPQSENRILLLLVPVVVCALYFPSRKIAGDDWLPIDPAELKMTSEPKAPGAPAIYLYRQVDRKDLGRNNFERNYVRIKILTDQWSFVAVDYAKTAGNLLVVRPRVLGEEASGLLETKDPANMA